ncbi:MAG: hypothetical protein AVDCRST_MAG68-1661, partial [uncultured Gemmatimonadetes bacterium]
VSLPLCEPAFAQPARPRYLPAPRARKRRRAALFFVPKPSSGQEL